MIAYHGSSIQGITEFKPKMSRTPVYRSLGKLIFGGRNKGIAALFCYKGHCDRVAKISMSKLTLKILDENIKKEFNKPCSIYTLEGDFKPIPSHQLELYSNSECIIINEEKFANVYDAFNKYGVKIL